MPKYEVLSENGFWGRYPSLEGALRVVKYLVKKGIDATIKIKGVKNA